MLAQGDTGIDSVKLQQLEEVVITATRNERTVGALPMPVTLVQSPQIKMMGSVRRQRFAYCE